MVESELVSTDDGGIDIAGTTSVRMLEIDGGDGGGQLLRSSLALSSVTGRPVRVTDIRGNRPEPGLKPQHLTVVETFAAVCTADVTGATLGSTALTFEPDSPSGGELSVDIGTAGSLSLLFDSLLPLAAVLEQPLSVTATGGTAVKWSPPLATYRRVTLSLARQFGVGVAVERERSGFYPEGGGRATLHLSPSPLHSKNLTDRGTLEGVQIISLESRDLTDSDVATRQAETARTQFERANVAATETQVITEKTISTGSSITVILRFENSIAGFDALGEPGKPAEDVAGDAVTPAISFLDTNAAVDRHAGDQLLILLALSGGRVSLPERTAHVESSLDLLATFGFGIEATGENPVVVHSNGPREPGT